MRGTPTVCECRRTLLRTGRGISGRWVTHGPPQVAWVRWGTPWDGFAPRNAIAHWGPIPHPFAQSGVPQSVPNFRCKAPLITEHLPNVEHWPIVEQGTPNLMRVQQWSTPPASLCASNSGAPAPLFGGGLPFCRVHLWVFFLGQAATNAAPFPR